MNSIVCKYCNPYRNQGEEEAVTRANTPEVKRTEDSARELSQAVLAEGIDAYYSITHGLTTGTIDNFAWYD